MRKLFIISFLLVTFFGCSSSRYVNDSDKEFSGTGIKGTLTGIASYYAHEFHGRKTASGEIYDMNKLTAAINNIPFETFIKVTRLSNNKSVTVRVNDRKPEFKNRIIDLSYGAAKVLDIINDGLAEVKLEILK